MALVSLGPGARSIEAAPVELKVGGEHIEPASKSGDWFVVRAVLVVEKRGAVELRVSAPRAAIDLGHECKGMAREFWYRRADSSPKKKGGGRDPVTILPAVELLPGRYVIRVTQRRPFTEVKLSATAKDEPVPFRKRERRHIGGDDVSLSLSDGAENADLRRLVVPVADQVHSVVLYSPKIDNEGLRELVELAPNLRDLSLRGASVSESGLAVLAGRPIKELCLREVEGLSDKVFDVLETLPQLEELDVRGAPIGDDARLSRLTTLEELTILGSERIRGEFLKAMPKLKWLWWERAGRPENLVALAGHPALETIWLDGLVKPKAKDIEGLASCPALQELNLDWDSRSSAKGPMSSKLVGALGRLAGLKKLKLQGPWLELDDLAALIESLSDTKIQLLDDKNRALPAARFLKGAAVQRGAPKQVARRGRKPKPRPKPKPEPKPEPKSEPKPEPKPKPKPRPEPKEPDKVIAQLFGSAKGRIRVVSDGKTYDLKLKTVAASWSMVPFKKNERARVLELELVGFALTDKERDEQRFNDLFRWKPLKNAPTPLPFALVKIRFRAGQTSYTREDVERVHIHCFDVKPRSTKSSSVNLDKSKLTLPAIKPGASRPVTIQLQGRQFSTSFAITVEVLIPPRGDDAVVKGEQATAGGKDGPGETGAKSEEADESTERAAKPPAGDSDKRRAERLLRLAKSCLDNGAREAARRRLKKALTLKIDKDLRARIEALLAACE